MKKSIILFILLFVIVLLIIGCSIKIRHFPEGANDKTCSSDSDCVISVATESKDNCCFECDVESINTNAERIRDEWSNKNCGNWQDECPIYDCQSAKNAKAICVNNTCQIEWVERENCHEEGEIFTRAPLPNGGQDLRPCCSGLTDITGIDISVCIKCGDKICKDYGSGFKEEIACPQDCMDKSCVQEGGIRAGRSDPRTGRLPQPCCNGLKLIDAITKGGGMMDYYYCTKCGDGNCKEPENKYSCPQDCS